MYDLGIVLLCLLINFGPLHVLDKLYERKEQKEYEEVRKKIKIMCENIKKVSK